MLGVGASVWGMGAQGRGVGSYSSSFTVVFYNKTAYCQEMGTPVLARDRQRSHRRLGSCAAKNDCHFV